MWAKKNIERALIFLCIAGVIANIVMFFTRVVYID